MNKDIGKRVRFYWRGGMFDGEVVFVKRRWFVLKYGIVFNVRWMDEFTGQYKRTETKIIWRKPNNVLFPNN